MNKIIRVVHFVNKMDRGGAETFLMNLFRTIDKKKVLFDFVVTDPNKGAYDDEIIELGGKIHVLSSPSNLLKYKKELRKLLLREKYDVVHSHAHYFSGINLKVANKCGIRNRIAHSHNTSDGRRNNTLINMYRNYMLKLIGNNSTELLACGEEAAKALYKTMSDDRIKVVKNGIDLSKFMNIDISQKNAREILGLPKEAYIVGNVARFQNQKNHTFLIDVFNDVYKKNNNSYLVLVGDGELRDEIQKKVISLGIEKNVIFMGVRAEIDLFMKSFDVFLFPSLYEGLGIVLIEAQAARIKCIASDTVPKEADLTGNIDFIPLDGKVDIWSESVLDKSINDIEDSKIYDYDINLISNEILQIYNKYEMK